MIKSRYKIEYVLPNEDVKKSSPLKILWYLVLIPLVILLVTAITYDFSIKRISQDSLVLIEKAKIHVFNLGNSQKPINSALPVVDKTAESAVLSNRVLTNNKVAIDNNKTLITELNAKQELQLKSIKTQIEKNTKLSKNLNEISEKLILEEVKTRQLNSRLAEQEKDKLELETQLNKLLTVSSLADNKKLKNTNAPKKKSKQLVIETPFPKLEESIKNPSVSEALKDIQSSMQKVAKEPEIKKTEKSETDKIIEAMANTSLNKNQDIEIKIEVTKSTDLSIQTKAKEISFIKDKKESSIKEETEINENTAIKKEKSPNTVAILNTQEIDTKIKSKENSDTEDKITEVSSKDNSDEIIDNSKAANNNSSVDDIIAAMQASQSNSKNTVSQDSTKELSPELKVEINNN